MDRYIKKPQEMEAVKLTAENVRKVADWCNGDLVDEMDALSPEVHYVGLNIPSMGEKIRASEGQIIQKIGEGMFAVHDAHIWERQFSLAETQDDIRRPGFGSPRSPWG